MHFSWRRERLLIGLVAVANGAIASGLCHSQSSRGGGDHSDAELSRGVDWRALPPPRGKILDRHGAALADNRSRLDLYVVPRVFSRAVRADLIELLQLEDAEVAQIDHRLAAAHDRGQGNQALLVLEDQSAQRQELVERARLDLAGAVEMHVGLRREYPHGELAAHLLGYLDHPDARGLSELLFPGYDETDRVGRFGIEQAFERSLRGTPGIERFRIDSAGERLEPSQVEELAGRALLEPPVPGHEVVLTIDLAVQKLAEEAVAGRAAAVVVAEVDTGRILALVSTPAFDPGAMTGPLAAAERERLGDDPREPYLDRTLQQAYPPASTYKLVTAVAGVEDGHVSNDEKVICTGERAVGERVLLDMHVHGEVDFLEALAVSCNVYFWQLGERVGLERLIDVAHDFGFGQPTGLAINGDVAGEVRDGRTLLPGTDRLLPTLQTAIGAGQVRVTVIQIAMAYAALVNGGRLFAPQVIRRVQTASGRIVDDREPILRHHVNASPETLALIRRGMWGAVNNRHGTAFVARKGAIKMAGKSGTAPPVERLSPERLSAARPGWHPAFPHAWFVGWAPVTRPQIVVAAVIEHAGVGGEVAGPIVHRIIDGYFTHVAPPARRSRRARAR